MPPKKPVVALTSRRSKSYEIQWNSVVKRAAEIVKANEIPMTLRQLYYRLVGEQAIPNKISSYKHLSRKTAQARREGWFPPLADNTRYIERFEWWVNGRASYDDMLATFMLDRTQGQVHQVYIGVEKHGMAAQLTHWFGKLGLPVLALGGYSSQTFVDVVAATVKRDGRPSVLIYAGDFDPSGMDIDRDFDERTDCFDEVVRIGLNRELVDKFQLPPAPGKETDSRSAQFILDHGELVQVELDALPLEELRKLYQEVIDQYWDEKTYKRVLKREERQRGFLTYLSRFVDRNGEVDPVHVALGALDDVDQPDDLDRVMDKAHDKRWDVG